MLSNLSALLLAWYEKNKRDLPWRKNISPYGIWISEMMAQQTRIAQLLPYYARFTEKFPAVEALAAASLDEVLAVWAGLGYYARARNLHNAAKIIVNEYAGEFPETRAGWERLPGVGNYTAGAVTGIAFGAREAAVDGNVLRVYSRLNDDETDISLPAAKKAAAAFLLDTMPDLPHDISRFTQALMELGALVCVPGKPLCANCPLAQVCLSRLNGTVSERPVKTPKKPQISIDMTVLLIIDPSGKVLMRKRAENLLRGMWVFFLKEEKMTEHEARETARGLGYTVNTVVPLGSASHTFTHRKWRMDGYALFVNETRAADDYVFLSPDDARKAALPRAIQYYTEWYFDNYTVF